MYGEAGADTLDGGANDDNLYGGYDNDRDTFIGGSGYDKAWNVTLIDLVPSDVESKSKV